MGLFSTRREAELVVENWNRDEPERAAELRVEPIELEMSPKLTLAVPRLVARLLGQKP